MAAEYLFISEWRVKATAEEVAEVLGDAEGLARWWPSVYLQVKVLEPGDPVTHVGKKVDLHTKGWLPYTLRWNFVVSETKGARGFKLVADGDFVGTGEWTFTPDGEFVNIRYDWRIRADKPLLRYGTFVFRPFFSANHRWAMARGEESLKAELERRHAKSP